MFIVTKLGRKSNPEGGHGNVYDGIQMCYCAASAHVPSDKAVVHLLKLRKNKEDPEALAAMAEIGPWDAWEQQNDLQPKIGFPVKFLANKMDAGTLRTSAVRSYYKHEGDSSDHPDKLVLPSEFPSDDLLYMDFPVMKKGDYLLATANSIYFAQLEKNFKMPKRP